MIAFWRATLALAAVMAAWMAALADGHGGFWQRALDLYGVCLPFAAVFAGLALWAFAVAGDAWDFALRLAGLREDEDDR